MEENLLLMTHGCHDDHSVLTIENVFSQIMLLVLFYLKFPPDEYNFMMAMVVITAWSQCRPAAQKPNHNCKTTAPSLQEHNRPRLL